MQQDPGSDRPVAHHPKRLFELPGLEAIRNSEQTRIMLLGVLVGAIGGLSAGLLDLAIVVLGRLILHSHEPGLLRPSFWPTLLGPVLAGLACGMLITWGTRRKAPQGIPEVIEGVVLENGHIPLREGLASGGSAAFAVAGGFSGGREGPIVQLASSVVSYTCRLLRIRPSHARVLVAAGAAAGIGASFNTPVAAAFFALEILLGNFALVSFAPVVAATVTGTVVGQVLLGGDRVALQLPPFDVENPLALLIYPILGVLCGVVAVSFKRVLLLAADLWERSPVPAAFRPALTGLGMGIIGVSGFNAVMGNGYGYMEHLISGADVGIVFLLALVVVKIVATAATSTSGSGAGIFAPSLFIGAVTGTLFGALASTIAPGLAGPPGAYGMVGMGAVAAAITQAPITMTLMLFEMTRNHEVILPLLITLAVAGLVSRSLEEGSIYLIQLERRGVRVDRAREELVMYEVHVEEVMRVGSHVTISPDAPFEELAERFLGTRSDEIYVVDGDDRFLGFVHLQDIKRLLAEPQKDVVVRDLIRTDAPTVKASQPLADTMALFFRSGLEALPVIDDDNFLIGVLTEHDVVGTYNREVLRKDALLARVESGSHDDRHTDFFVLPEGHVMDRIVVGRRFASRTLRELHLPRRYGLTVIAVDVLNEEGGFDRHPAEVDLRLKVGDRMVVVGAEGQVEAMREHREDEPTVVGPPLRQLDPGDD
ncbi:MAG: chloride channel protein [Deltaproteobacteria bacterium]|nr:chloride channel protein [Deltaproteobacteria bacterium]